MGYDSLCEEVGERVAFVRKGIAMSDDEALFSGLRVIEVATMFMAPIAGTMLADFGAEVIKVEAPDGDLLRKIYTNKGMPESDIDYCFLMVNRNKKGIALNLKAPEGLEALRRLVKSADVFITNFRPQAQKRLKISYEDVKDLNPRLIFAYGSGYGETGPDVDQPGYDHICYWTRSGIDRGCSLLTGAGSDRGLPRWETTRPGSPCSLLSQRRCTGGRRRARAGRFRLIFWRTAPLRILA